ncbi:MAG: hypothetical protein V4754_19970 [Pseudomonadota bacterium]
MTAPQATVGIDVGKQTLRVALLLQGEVRHQQVDNNGAGYRWLRRWLADSDIAIAGLQVCMARSRPFSESAALAFTAMGMVVVAVDPVHVARFARQARAGTPFDATLLACYCALTQPAPWVPPAPAYRQLRAALEQWRALRHVRQADQGALRRHRRDGQLALAGQLAGALALVEAELDQVELDIGALCARHPELAEAAESLRAIAPARRGAGAAPAIGPH